MEEVVYPVGIHAHGARGGAGLGLVKGYLGVVAALPLPHRLFVMAEGRRPEDGLDRRGAGEANWTEQTELRRQARIFTDESGIFKNIIISYSKWDLIGVLSKYVLRSYKTRGRLDSNVAPSSGPTTSVNGTLHECKKVCPCTKALLLSGIRAWIKQGWRKRKKRGRQGFELTGQFEKGFQNLKKKNSLVCRVCRDEPIDIYIQNTLHFDQYSRLAVYLNFFFGFRPLIRTRF